MESSTIIGLAGKKRSGKDTLARYIVAHYGFKPISFAAALRLEVREAYGFGGVFEDALKDRPIHGLYGQTPRDILRTWGQMRRDENPDYWVNEVANYCHVRQGNFVITDMRMPNELAWVQSQGGKTIRVCRPAINHIVDTHETECALDGVDLDFTVTNVELKDDMFHSFDTYAASIGLTKTIWHNV